MGFWWQSLRPTLPLSALRPCSSFGAKLLPLPAFGRVRAAKSAAVKAPHYWTANRFSISWTRWRPTIGTKPAPVNTVTHARLHHRKHHPHPQRDRGDHQSVSLYDPEGGYAPVRTLAGLNRSNIGSEHRRASALAANDHQDRSASSRPDRSGYHPRRHGRKQLTNALFSRGICPADDRQNLTRKCTTTPLRATPLPQSQGARRGLVLTVSGVPENRVVCPGALSYLRSGRNIVAYGRCAWALTHSEPRATVVITRCEARSSSRVPPTPTPGSPTPRYPWSSASMSQPTPHSRRVHPGGAGTCWRLWPARLWRSWHPPPPW